MDLDAKRPGDDASFCVNFRGSCVNSYLRAFVRRMPHKVISGRVMHVVLCSGRYVCKADKTMFSPPLQLYLPKPVMLL